MVNEPVSVSPHGLDSDFLDEPSKPLDIQALLLSLARSKLLIFLCGVLGVLAVWLLLMRVPTTYRASVEILPPQIARSSMGALLGQGGGDAGVLGSLGASMQAKGQTDMFVVILNAWPIQDALVQQFDLVHAYQASDAAAARYILGGNTILKSSKEGFISITIVDTDKKRSAAIANAYVDRARDFLRGMALSEASQRRQFYEAQLAKTKDDLAQAEVAFQHMQQSSGMVSLDSQAKSLLDTAAALRSQITAKQVQLQSLRGYSTESNPQVQIAESELSALQGQLTQLESRGQGGYSGKSLTSVPGAELEFVRATRELKYQEGLYDLMVKGYEGSKIDEARDAPAIQVIEPALVPDHKAGPRRLRDLRLGFIAGLVFGVVLAVARHAFSRISPETRGKMTEVRRAALHW